MRQLDLLESRPPEAVDLHAYDVVVISSSGGKDSQAMLAHVVRLADAVHYARSRILVAHADLGRVEWPGTLRLARAQAAHFGLRFVSVTRPQGDLLTQVLKRGMWPSPKQRYCTSDHKRAQLAKVVTGLHRDARKQGHEGRFRVLECIGLRADESPSRAKAEPFGRNARLSTLRRDVDTWLPIHGWSVDEVWSTIRRSGAPHHRAYDLGMPRLSCCFCIFSPRAALKLAAKHNPELFDEYVRLEKRIDHRFRADLSLAELASAPEGDPDTTIADWAM